MHLSELGRGRPKAPTMPCLQTPGFRDDPAWAWKILREVIVDKSLPWRWKLCYVIAAFGLNLFGNGHALTQRLQNRCAQNVSQSLHRSGCLKLSSRCALKTQVDANAWKQTLPGHFGLWVSQKSRMQTNINSRYSIGCDKSIHKISKYQKESNRACFVGNAWNLRSHSMAASQG